jgi:Domain of unknown function (DUF4280)
MANQVSTGAALACTFGATPADFTASSVDVSATTPAGGITDVSPENIPTFGLCTSLANPAVASATAAAGSPVPVPQPCIPELSPWTPGSGRVTMNGISALNNTSQCACAYGGVITVSFPGQVRVTVE